MKDSEEEVEILTAQPGSELTFAARTWVKKSPERYVADLRNGLEARIVITREPKAEYVCHECAAKGPLRPGTYQLMVGKQGQFYVKEAEYLFIDEAQMEAEKFIKIVSRQLPGSKKKSKKKAS